MRTLTGNEPRVQVCAHCGGTGLCARGTLKDNHHHHWLECPECGRGVPSVVGDELDLDNQRPICAQCGGSGMVHALAGSGDELAVDSGSGI